jgi:hypothetical protein
MSDEQELRDDTPPKPDDETWQMGDPPEEGKEGEEQDPASKNEVARVAETETPREDESTPVQDEPDESADLDWNENEPSPHQGEEGQEGEA